MCISVQKKHSGTQCGTQSGTQFSPKDLVKNPVVIPIGDLNRSPFQAVGYAS
jgi:hypothetical protein